jgi:hypothetical protein
MTNPNYVDTKPERTHSVKIKVKDIREGQPVPMTNPKHVPEWERAFDERYTNRLYHLPTYTHDGMKLLFKEQKKFISSTIAKEVEKALEKERMQIGLQILPALLIDENEDGNEWYNNLHKVVREVLSRLKEEQ